MATLVLIHGAFHNTTCWRRLVPFLEKADVPFFLVDRSVPETSTRRAAVSWDPELEAAQVNNIIDGSIDGPVVLVGHSKGGDAITFGGNHEQVVGLVYLAAHVPGIDVPDSITVTNPKLKQGFIDNGDGTWDCNPKIAKELFYSDYDFGDDDNASTTISELLRPQARPCKNKANLSHAYESKKSTYMVCTEDQTTFPEAQRYWAEKLRKEHGCETLELPSGHSPFWSNPKLLADQLIGIAKDASDMAKR